METVWLSSLRMTVSVDVNDQGWIVDGADIVHKFIGQPLTNLESWMAKQGGLEECLL